MLGFAPQCDSEHSSQFGEALFVPLQKGTQDGFRIGMGFEVMSQVFQFGAQLEVIVNLSVEDDPTIAVFGKNGLIAMIQVDDFQPRRAQRKKFGLKDALLVGPAVNQCGCCLPDSFRRCAPIFSGEPRNSAQRSAPLPAARCSRA